MLYSLTKKRGKVWNLVSEYNLYKKNNTMKHFYHYLLTVFPQGKYLDGGRTQRKRNTSS